MDRKRLIIGGVLVASSVLVALAVFLTSIREPAFDGRPLSFWLVELESVRTSAERRTTQQALATILTNSPSSVVDLACAYESSLGQRGREWLKEQLGMEFRPSAHRRRGIGMRVLELTGPAAAPAVPELVDRLGHRRSIVRRLAARALEVLGPTAQEAAHELSVALFDADEGVALRAVEALKAIGTPATESVLNSLRMGAMDTKRPREFRRNCIQTLAACGSAAAIAIPDLLILSKSEVEVVRFSAVRGLGRVGLDRVDLLPLVMAALKDPALSVREAALDAMEAMAPTSRGAVAALNRVALQDQAPRLRVKAVGVIDAIDPPLERVIETLIQVWKARASSNHMVVSIPENLRRGGAACVEALVPYLDDPNEVFVGQVLGFLGEVGAEASLAAEPMRRILSDPSRASLHVQAASKLLQIDPTALEPIPLLLSRLQSDDERIRGGAVVGLGEVRPLETSVIRALIGHFSIEENPFIRQRLIWGLERRPEVRSLVVSAVTGWLKDPSPYVREAALNVLTDYGPEALPSLGELVGFLDDENDEVRCRAVVAIGILGPKAEAAIPRLIEIMRDREYVEQRETGLRQQANSGQKPGMFSSGAFIHNPARGLRGDCAAALGRIGHQDASLVSVLIEAVKDEDLKKEAIKSLGRFRGEAAAAIPILSKIVAEEKGVSRGFAAMALQLIQPVNDHAIDSLILRAERDEGDELQVYALEALGILGSVASSARQPLEQILETTPYEVVRIWGKRALARLEGQ